MALIIRRTLRSDDLYEATLQRQALRVVARTAGVAGLAKGPELTNDRYRTYIVVLALERPGRDGRVMHRSVEG